MIIGIDTSCYTTSLAVIEKTTEEILFDRRRLLQIKLGERGLRQSEAVFQHLKNLPELLNMDTGLQVSLVSAAVSPRPVAGSYLPVFKVGESFGESIAGLLGVPFLSTSHQEGHIRAGLTGYQGQMTQTFLAWHVSGGTTELLKVAPKDFGYDITKIGGSTDLQVGQFIDRVGVALGGGFPAGVFLEKLALQSFTSETLPVVTKDLTVSFSGPASAAERLIKSGADQPEIAKKVFNCIAKSLFKVTMEAINRFQINQVLIVGGVASNQLIREFLLNNGSSEEIEFIFGAKELSSDNAVGVGLIGFDYYRTLEESNE